MNKYEFSQIERKWQEYWASTGYGISKDEGEKKHYHLVEFPYPSGEGLHVGHCMGYSASDAYCRMKRMQGFNVMFPIGWDAFGLPTENYAIKQKIQPQAATINNVANFKTQMRSLGYSFDWSREVNTTDPNYYKWTQWIFLQFYKHAIVDGKLVEVSDDDTTTPRLAYQAEIAINWCPSCKIGLANEEVIAGKCERCGTETIKKMQKQWLLRITAYADRLIKDLDTVDYQDRIKTQQINWIGRSEGTEIKFPIKSFDSILFSTTNQAKIKRIQKIASRVMPGVTVKSPADFNIEAINIEEGNDLTENAKLKARAYKNKVDIPILSIDTAFYIDNEEINPVQVKRNALGDKRETDLTQEEIANLIIEYYKNIASKHGGKVDAFWKDVLVLIYPDGEEKVSESIREVLLTDSVIGEIDIHVPLRSMYISKSTGKFISEQTEDDEIKELQPIANALLQLIESIEVFTTRADTLFGVTYMAIAPEHPLLMKLESRIENQEEVKKYIDDAAKKSDMERTELTKEKTGVEVKGIKVINPLSKEEIPIFVADYVLASYGTGAIMAVPAHDERDFEFATKYDIPIKQVIAPFYTATSGPGSVRPDKETSRRKTICAIVKHWSEEKYYCLDWEKFNWHSFVLGGIDEGESAEEAAIRETKEETGYQNIKSTKKIGMLTHNYFFANHKDVNRYAESQGILIELADDSFVEPAEEHIKNHKGFWLDKEKVGEFINLPHNCYYWDIFINGVQSYENYGILINSGEFDNLGSEEAKKATTEKLSEIGAGKAGINYKLRDWVFSRQHYWGEPIPIVHCDPPAGGCGIVPLDENDLPLELPEVENYQPTNTGQSPLANISDWVNTTCPKCGCPAKRETDTMPNWAGSSWYFLRYCDPNDINEFASMDKLKYWTPVDLYNGGMEHTTLHLLYSRFWHKFLYDLGHVPTLEPYAKRIAHGIILGPDGQKMSKSRGNVINPDEIVKRFGADTLRAYIMFIGSYDQESAWNASSIQGVYRFINRLWNNFELVNDQPDEKELLIKLNQTINGITSDIESFNLNTVVSKLMEMNNMIEKTGHISKDSYSTYLKLIFPVMPHIASELYKMLEQVNIETKSWPKADSNYLSADQIEIVVQINGKVRAKMMQDSNITDQEMVESALNLAEVKKYTDGKNITKTIPVSKKLVSIVLD